MFFRADFLFQKTSHHHRFEMVKIKIILIFLTQAYTEKGATTAHLPDIIFSPPMASTHLTSRERQPPQASGAEHREVVVECKYVASV